MKKISVIIPALNEEKYIGQVIKIVKNCKLIDEIIVVDNNSTDKTSEIARNLGVKTLLCENRGKGYAMEMGLENASGNIVVFADGDICNYQPDFLEKMIDPIINEQADFVKSSFERTGGRVTELVAKPLLELTFPALAKFEQPLSGIIAGKKEVFKHITFEKDYGVDIGILIDVYNQNFNITQVKIGSIKNDSQNWKNLIEMAKQVSKAILKRFENSN